MALSGLAALLLFILAGIIFGTVARPFWGILLVIAGLAFTAVGIRAPTGGWQLVQIILSLVAVAVVLAFLLLFMVFAVQLGGD